MRKRERSVSAVRSGEHAGGKRTELVADQTEILQRGQVGEHAGGKRGELVEVQSEIRQRGQAGERADGKRTELVAAQSEIRQRGQAGERADGKRTELVAAQSEIRQRGQVGEVARLQGLDDNRGEIQRHHAGQVRPRHVGAVRHAEVGGPSHDRVPHLLGAPADAGPRRRRTGRHPVAVAVSVHHAQLERVGHVVGQARHHDPVLVDLAHPAVVDLRPLVVVARGLEAVLVVPDIRVLRRRVPGERHLLVAVRRRETRRPRGRCAVAGRAAESTSSTAVDAARARSRGSRAGLTALFEGITGPTLARPRDPKNSGGGGG